MKRNFNISNDGTIYEIKDDGTISKLARIDESGNILPIGEGASSTSNKNSGGKGVLWFILIVLIALTTVLAISYVNLKGEYDYVSYQLQNKTRNYSSEVSKYESQVKDLSSKASKYESQVNDLRREVSTLQSRIQKIGNKVPFIVTDVKMGNMNDDGSMYSDYGSSIYSSSSMYLSPKIYYDGVKSGSYKIYWKIFKPDGSMSNSTSGTIYISEGDNHSDSMGGWGSKRKGFWDRGTYRIEIWYNDSCIKSKNFTIY